MPCQWCTHVQNALRQGDRDYLDWLYTETGMDTEGEDASVTCAVCGHTRRYVMVRGGEAAVCIIPRRVIPNA